MIISLMIYKLLEKYAKISEVISDGTLIYFFGLNYIFFIDSLIFSYPIELYFLAISLMHSSTYLKKLFFVYKISF